MFMDPPHYTNYCVQRAHLKFLLFALHLTGLPMSMPMAHASIRIKCGYSDLTQNTIKILDSRVKATAYQLNVSLKKCHLPLTIRHVKHVTPSTATSCIVHAAWLEKYSVDHLPLVSFDGCERQAQPPRMLYRLRLTSTELLVYRSVTVTAHNLDQDVICFQAFVCLVRKLHVQTFYCPFSPYLNL
jgi:hypothetical protein